MPTMREHNIGPASHVGPRTPVIHKLHILHLSSLTGSTRRVRRDTPALAKTRADRKVFQLVEFADRARRVHARACVCASERLLCRVLHAESM
jgi:hypothetical protein